MTGFLCSLLAYVVVYGSAISILGADFHLWSFLAGFAACFVQDIVMAIYKAERSY